MWSLHRDDLKTLPFELILFFQFLSFCFSLKWLLASLFSEVFFVRRVQVFGVTKKRRRGAMMSIDDSFSHRLRIFWDFERKMALEVQKYFMKKMFQIGHTETVRPSLKVGLPGRTRPGLKSRTDLICRKLRTIFAIW